jgi:hypothetical protein
VSRAAGWLLAFAALAVLLAAGSGALLIEPFRGLLDDGAGAVPAFRSSRSTQAHRWLGLGAAFACLPLAATGLLLGLHGLLATHGPRVRAALLGVLAPLLLAFGLGAAFTGHAAWDRTRMSELQLGLVEGFLRVHGLVFGGGLIVGLATFAAAWWWLRRAESPEDED